MSISDCMMPAQDRAQGLAAAKILGRSLAEVAADLRLIDAADLVAYIRLGQFANIGDLVNSSAELFFKEGTLSFAWAAEAEVRWGSPPKISLDMEFRHREVTVFFNFTLRARQGIVAVHRVLFDDPAAAQDAESGLRWLSEALADARLPVPRTRPTPKPSAS